MNNKPRGICAGGDYTGNEKKEYHPCDPSKRHNAKTNLKFLSPAERKILANYIIKYTEYEYIVYGNFVTPEMINNAINAFASINYNE